MPDVQGEKTPNELEAAQFAVKNNLITQTQLDECVKIAQDVSSAGLHKSVNQVIVEKGYITQGVLNSVLHQLGKSLAEVDKYEILAKLGEGGMGAVYKVRHKTNGKIYALKTLRKELAKDKEYLERFSREVWNVSGLTHPNIVSAVDYGEHKGMHYFVMEYVEGEGLDKIIARRGKISEKESADIIMQVADALSYADKRHIVHRDIKPANIIITKDGRAKLCDLGIAKSTDKSSIALTMTGLVVGSPHYLSPEQVQGRKEIDIRSDIYSLGVTLFNMITGRVPFDGDSPMAIAMKRLNEKPPLPTKYVLGLSKVMEDVILKMMAAAPSLRYQKPSEVVSALEPIAKGSKVAKEDVAVHSASTSIDAVKGNGSGSPVSPVRKDLQLEGLSNGAERPNVFATAIYATKRFTVTNPKLMEGIYIVGGVVGVLGIIVAIFLFVRSGEKGDSGKPPAIGVVQNSGGNSNDIKPVVPDGQIKEENMTNAETAKTDEETERLKRELEEARAKAEEADRLRKEAEMKVEGKLKKEAELARIEAERVEREREIERLKKEAEDIGKKIKDEFNSITKDGNLYEREKRLTRFINKNLNIAIFSKYVSDIRGFSKDDVSNVQKKGELRDAITNMLQKVKLYKSQSSPTEKIKKTIEELEKKIVADKQEYLNQFGISYDYDSLHGEVDKQFLLAISSLKTNEEIAEQERIRKEEGRLRKESDDYYNRGDEKYSAGDYRGAISDYDKAIELNPKSASLYHNRGLAMDEVGDYKGAVADFTKAIELNSDYATAYSNRGFVKHKLGDYKGAITDFDRAIRINANLATAYLNRGNAKYMTASYKGALSDWQKAIELNPSFRTVLQPKIEEIKGK